jgi:glycine hydroxymethyltransferase
MLLKVEKAGENGTPPTLKNMHVPHFPEMSLFHTDIEFPKTDSDCGKVIVTHRSPGSGKSQKLEVPLQPDVTGLKPLQIVMHRSPTTGYDMGSQYNDWFSECFGYPVKLAYLGSHSRQVLGTLAPGKHTKGLALLGQTLWPTEGMGKWLNPILAVALAVKAISMIQEAVQENLPLMNVALLVALLAPVAVVVYYTLSARSPEDRITFADCAPYLVISSKSVSDVSARLPEGERMDHTKFRPNIVVSGAENAFEEDFWSALTVGPDRTRLFLTGNCVRCKSLNVDFATGKIGTGESGNVLKKLMKDRRVDRGAKYSPAFGRYSFLDPAGAGRRIRVGDEVGVSQRNEKRTVLGKCD